MIDVPRNGPPSVTEVARRLQRVEDKLDERIASQDMLHAVERGLTDRIAAVERLFEAKLIGQQVAVSDNEKRISKVEGSLSKVNFALLGAFLTLLVMIITVILSATGRQPL